MNNVLGTIASVIATMLLLGYAVNLASNATEGSRAQSALQQVEVIRRAVESLSQAQPDYSSATVGLLVQTNAVPESMISSNAWSGGSGPGIVDPWGQFIWVGPAWWNNGWFAFWVELDGVPTKSCSSIANYLPDGGIEVCINWASCSSQPSPSWASQYCTAGGSGQNGGNKLDWLFQ